MHHYPFHPSDYLMATAHLTPMEDIAYRRLLDLYYSTEFPIPLETQSVSRRLRLDTEVIAKVLEEFFTRCDDGFRNARCDDEIANYQSMKERNAQNGKKGGRPTTRDQSTVPAERKAKKSERLPINNPVGSQSQPTGKPTKNQEPRTNLEVSKDTSSRFFDFWQTWPQSERKQDKAKCEERWKSYALDAVADQILADVNARKGGQKWRDRKYIESPLVYLNNKRWEDGFAPDPPPMATHIPTPMASKNYREGVTEDGCLH